MSELDKMIANLNLNVKPKNEILEYQINNLNDIPTETTGYAKHIDEEQSWTGKVNRVYTKLLQKAEDAKLTDTFRPMASTEIKSTTARSLEATIARYYQQASIINSHS